MPSPVRPASPATAITVFLSSASKVDGVYFNAATELGRAIAQQGWVLVYGGNNIGCMGALADGARDAGGRVVGVTPKYFIDQGVADNLCDELVVVESMRERKFQLEQRADAFVALPGGLGTFEELFEIIVGRQLGLHHKPVVLLNVNDYYTPLLDLIDRGVEQRFVRAEARGLIRVADTVERAVGLLKTTLR